MRTPAESTDRQRVVGQVSSSTPRRYRARTRPSVSSSSVRHLLREDRRLLVVFVDHERADPHGCWWAGRPIASPQRREPAVDEVVFNLAPAYLKLSFALTTAVFFLSYVTSSGVGPAT